MVDITKGHNVDVVATFESTQKPTAINESTASEIDKEILKEEIKEYVKDLKLLKSNLRKAYSIMYGNCTDGVQAMIKADEDHESKSKAFDHQWLFEKVKKIVSGLDTKVNLRVSLHATIINFMLTKQQPHESNNAYLTRFKSMSRTLAIAGGEHILVSDEMLGKNIGTATADEVKDEKERFLAIYFILRSDENRYKKLLEDLKSSGNRGRDEYPTTLTGAFDLLVRESGEYDTNNQNARRQRGRFGNRGRGNFIFAQNGRNEYTRANDTNSDEVVAGTDGVTLATITCFGCHFKGHYKGQCPYATGANIISAHVGYMLTQVFFSIPKSWVLLDTCSTCNVSNNLELVTNVEKCEPKDVLTAHTNGGSQKYDHIADLRLLPIKVHFKKDSMGTILCFKTVCDIPGARVTFDSSSSTDIVLLLRDGTTILFKQFQNGLYYHDTSTVTHNDYSNNSLSNYIALQTVKSNK